MKRTFKSASGSLKTFSRSGGSARTGGTARTPGKKRPVAGRYTGAIKKINGMSSDEFRQTLVRLGISKPDGKLTAKYTTTKKK
jgi:hypothetical protein